MQRIYNVTHIKKKKYKTADFDLEYAQLFGVPETNFTAMFYGESGSGKTVQAIKFADYYADHFGKVLYNSHEERIGLSIQERLNEYNIQSAKLYVADRLNYEDMMNKIDRNRYRLVIIDSVQYMEFSFEQLRKRFAKRQLAILMVSFGATKGKPDGARDLLHASDIKAFFWNGRINVTSRFLPKPIEQQLFLPKRINNIQQTLF